MRIESTAAKEDYLLLRESKVQRRLHPHPPRAPIMVAKVRPRLSNADDGSQKEDHLLLKAFQLLPKEDQGLPKEDTGAGGGGQTRTDTQARFGGHPRVPRNAASFNKGTG